MANLKKSENLDSSRNQLWPVNDQSCIWTYTYWKKGRACYIGLSIKALFPQKLNSGNKLMKNERSEYVIKKLLFQVLSPVA